MGGAMNKEVNDIFVDLMEDVDETDIVQLECIFHQITDQKTVESIMSTLG